MTGGGSVGKRGLSVIGENITPIGTCNIVENGGGNGDDGTADAASGACGGGGGLTSTVIGIKGTTAPDDTVD